MLQFMGEVSYKIYREKLHILSQFCIYCRCPQISDILSSLYLLRVSVRGGNTISFLSAKDSVPHLFKKNDNSTECIYNSVLIYMLVNCTGVPVLAWIDTPKFVQYLHKWEQFQVGSISSYYSSVPIENNNYFSNILFQKYGSQNSQSCIH